jgi:hypothetical protein
MIAVQNAKRRQRAAAKKAQQTLVSVPVSQFLEAVQKTKRLQEQIGKGDDRKNVEDDLVDQTEVLKSKAYNFLFQPSQAPLGRESESLSDIQRSAIRGLWEVVQMEKMGHNGVNPSHPVALQQTSLQLECAFGITEGITKYHLPERREVLDIKDPRKLSGSLHGE